MRGFTFKFTIRTKWNREVSTQWRQINSRIFCGRYGFGRYGCGRYWFSVWPIWFFAVANMAVANMVCGRYGRTPLWVCTHIILLWPIWLWPIWFVADMVAPWANYVFLYDYRVNYNKTGSLFVVQKKYENLDVDLEATACVHSLQYSTVQSHWHNYVIPASGGVLWLSQVQLSQPLSTAGHSPPGRDGFQAWPGRYLGLWAGPDFRHEHSQMANYRDAVTSLACLHL